MFSGSIVALAVPFAGKTVDERSLAEFVSWQIRRGTAALAVNTAVGEAPTLTADERSRVILLVRERAGPDVPVIAAICTSCTARGVEEAGRAEAAGASALLVTAPPYSRPTPEGALRHLETIAGATDLPVVIQNDRARTRVTFGPASLTRLAAIPSVVGFADGSGDLPLGLPACTRKSLAAYTTQDSMAAPFVMAGGAGTISALANITPRLCADMHLAIRRGVFAEAAAIQRRLFPLIAALGPDADPGAVKYGLFLLRAYADPTPRLPLVAASCTTARAIAAALAGLGDDVRSE